MSRQTGHFSIGHDLGLRHLCSSAQHGAWLTVGTCWTLAASPLPRGRARQAPEGLGGVEEGTPRCCCLNQRPPSEWNPDQKLGGSWIKGSGQDEETQGKVLLLTSLPPTGSPLKGILERGQGLKNASMEGDTVQCRPGFLKCRVAMSGF